MALKSGSRILSMTLSGTVGVGMALSSCTTAQNSPPSVTSSPAPATATTSSAASSQSATPSPSANAVTIDITISGGKVSPNGRKIDVAVGQKVILNVRSDVDEEIHAHGAGEGYELMVRAGRQATGSFVASDRGRFPVEAHELEKVIAILNVR
jgi:hypothetical protein